VVGRGGVWDGMGWPGVGWGVGVPFEVGNTKRIQETRMMGISGREKSSTMSV